MTLTSMVNTVWYHTWIVVPLRLRHKYASPNHMAVVALILVLRLLLPWRFHLWVPQTWLCWEGNLLVRDNKQWRWGMLIKLKLSWEVFFFHRGKVCKALVVLLCWGVWNCQAADRLLIAVHLRIVLI
jgi:hypothetical protein